MKRISTTAIASVALISLLHAQRSDVKICHQSERTREWIESHPEQKSAIEEAEAELEEFTRNFSSDSRTAPAQCPKYVIPVVFHILHDNGPDNLSDVVIKQQIKRLNLDFKNLSSDTVDVMPAFKSIIGGMSLEFRLAQIDPDGNPTTGIMRYQTQETYSAGESIKPGRQWPRSKYLNVYTARDIGGAAGYTYTPGSVSGDPTRDAILVLYDYIGADSRTLTHEVGHWFNLQHCWGGTNDPAVQSNCNTDDGVSDTPNTIGWQQCNLNGATCGSALDNVQNYMEYSYCSNMFTKGQCTRMEAALNSSTAQRSTLWSDTTIQATGLADLTVANFSVTSNVVCVGESVTYFDESTYGACSWTWQFGGAEPAVAFEQYPTVSYPTEGVFDVNYTAAANSASLTANRFSYILVTDPSKGSLPFSESFENVTIPGNEWLIVNPDNDLRIWQKTGAVGYQSSSAVMVNNFNAPETGRIEVLHSKGFDLSNMTTANLTFRVASAQVTSSSTDLLRVYFSNTCGETWSLRWGKSGSQLTTVPVQTNAYTPSSAGEWLQFTIPVSSSYLIDHFMMKFEFVGGGGNHLYLDDINLTGTYKQSPILKSPLDQTSGLGTAVTLDWKAVGNVNFYQYELDTSASFNSPVLITGYTAYISSAHNGPDTKIDVNNLIPGAKYYWRVRTETAAIPSGWSSVWSFNISANGVGMTEQKPELFSVYPNPGSDRITIHNGALTGEGSVALFDGQGRLVKAIYSGALLPGSDYQFNASAMAEGIYLVRVQTAQENRTVRLILR